MNPKCAVSSKNNLVVITWQEELQSNKNIYCKNYLFFINFVHTYFSF